MPTVRAPRLIRAAWMLAGFYGLAVAAVTILGVLRGDATWWLDAANILSFWLLVGSLPLLVAALLAGRVAPAMALAPAFACWCVLYGPLFLPQSVSTDADVRIASYNVFAEVEPQIEHVAELVDAVQPDVLLLQEIRGRPQSRLAEALRDFPHQWFARDRDSLYEAVVGVVSRYPIVDVEPIAGLPQGARDTAVVTLDVNGRALHVVSLHLTSPCLACPLREQPAQLARRSARRAAETRAVAAALPASNVVVAGDLNSSTLNGPRQILLDAGLRDVQQTVGWGLGATRSVGPLAVRIDWMFASPELEPVAAWVGDSRASDHRPVIVDLRFPESGG